MKNADPSSQGGLPELAYGSVWLVSAGAGLTKEQLRTFGEKIMPHYM